MVKVIGYDLAKKKFQELEDKINGKYNRNDTVDRAYSDASGRSISGTYATKDEVRRKYADFDINTIDLRVYENEYVHYYGFTLSARNIENGITMRVDYRNTNSTVIRWTYLHTLSASEIRSGIYKLDSDMYLPSPGFVMDYNFRFTLSTGTAKTYFVRAGGKPSIV